VELNETYEPVDVIARSAFVPEDGMAGSLSEASYLCE
jgi:hypothetical protein